MKNRTEEVLKSEFYALSPEDWIDLLFGEDGVENIEGLHEDYRNGKLYEQLSDEDINKYLNIHCWDELEKIYTMDFDYLSKHSFYFDNTESERHDIISTWFNNLPKDDFELCLSEYIQKERLYPRIKKLLKQNESN